MNYGVELKKIRDIQLLENWLGSTGFVFPSSELELDRFNKLYEDYDNKLDNVSIDPISIIKNTFHREPRVITMLKMM